MTEMTMAAAILVAGGIITLVAILMSDNDLGCLVGILGGFCVFVALCIDGCGYYGFRDLSGVNREDSVLELTVRRYRHFRNSVVETKYVRPNEAYLIESCKVIRQRYIDEGMNTVSEDY